MKKTIYEEIEVPEGVEVTIGNNEVSVSGKEGSIVKKMNFLKMDVKKEGNKIVVGGEKITQTEKKMLFTIISHIRNMIEGVQEKYSYELKICFNHFPITLDISGNEAKIKNFLGEKIPRVAKILEGVEVKVNNDIISLKSVDKELAGQTAANFEAATKVRNRDRRVFQDGLFIITKCGRSI